MSEKIQMQRHNYDVVVIGAGGAGQMTQQIRSKLVDIQRGIAADAHGWVQRID